MSQKDVGGSKKDNGSSEVFYEQLQSEYNKLLKRYAEAENTIDELRTGARIQLYSDSQDAKQVNCSNSQDLRHSQRINFPRPLQAVVSSTDGDTEAKSAGIRPSIDHKHPSKYGNMNGNTKESSHGNTGQQHFIEGRVKMLKENVDSLENCLAEFAVNEITPENLKEISSLSHQLGEDHKKLHSELRERPHTSTPSGTTGETSNFSSRNGLEQELFRVGLRLQDIQQDVGRKMKSNSPTHSKPNKTIESNSRESVKPTSPSLGISSLDPDLANLITKLKDLRNSSVKSNQELQCRVDGQGSRRISEDGGAGTSAKGSTRSHKRDLSSPDDHYIERKHRKDHSSPDIVDARYLTPSPVHHDYNDYGTASHRSGNDVDQFTFDVEPTTHHSPTIVNGSHLNHHYPSGSTRDHTEPPIYTEQPNTTHDLRSYSKDDNSSHRSQPPIYGNHENPSSNARGSFAYKNGQPKSTVDENAPTIQPRKSSSMSDVACSSRMSTPLFHPRGSTRVGAARDETRAAPAHKPHKTKYKSEQSSNGFDSGFIGSEESRSSRMTESPNIPHKLNLSNQWDSSVHLNLSEISENDSVSSHEPLSTTYETVTNPVRRSTSPVHVDLRDSTEFTFLNTSPSPPSSPGRVGNNTSHFRHNTSHTASKRSSRSSSPVPRIQLSDPPLSRISEKQPSERSSHTERTPRVNRDNVGIMSEHSRTGSREPSINENRGCRPRRMRERIERKSDNQERDTLGDIRNDITGLRDQLENVLGQSRVSFNMYDDFRHEDEELRNSLGRENDRRYNELRLSIERLRNEFTLRTKSHRPRRHSPTNSDDDLRVEVKNLSEKLHELSELRKSVHRISPPPSGAPSVSIGNHTADQFSGLAQRVDGLRLQVDELRSRIENETELDTTGCRLCDDVTTNHHSYYPTKSRMSSPLVTHVYETPQQTTKKSPTLRNLSASYPGVHLRPPVVHHVHTYHKTPRVKKEDESDSSSDETSKPRRTQHSTRPRRPRYQVRRHNRRRSDDPVALDEARHAAKDVQRLSKTILNKISLDLASFSR